jgi:hypothetical protein
MKRRHIGVGLGAPPLGFRLTADGALVSVAAELEPVRYILRRRRRERRSKRLPANWARAVSGRSAAAAGTPPTVRALWLGRDRYAPPALPCSAAPDLARSLAIDASHGTKCTMASGP